MNYLILSLKWSPSIAGYAVWWGPDDCDYTEDMNQAGRYTQEQVDKKPGYYNNGRTTFAIPEEEAMAKAKAVALGELSQFWVPQRNERRKRGMGVVKTGEPDCLPKDQRE
jgi:hypothetical protein